MPGARESGEEVTGLLRAWRQEDSAARDELLERVSARLERVDWRDRTHFFGLAAIERDLARFRA